MLSLNIFLTFSWPSKLNLAEIFSFGSAYMGVVIIEPLVDMAVLSAVKAFYRTSECSMMFDKKLCKAS